MNAVEIEEGITALAEQPFDATEFPFAFLECFDNSAARSKKLRKGTSNKSDIDGVLQAANNGVHIKVAETGQVPETIAALKQSKATKTKRNKVRFVLATDGEQFEAEDLTSGDVISCDYRDFPNHFVFFWPIAGLSKTKQISESEFDVRATLRLNKLYVTLLRDNPDWATAERRQDMNHFMARLIFLFFAEDTDILNGEGLFTDTVEQMSNRDGSNTHEVIGEIFRAMDVNTYYEGKPDNRYRKAANLPRWADAFPYVNGALFSGGYEVPKFSRIAQRYLIQIGNLNWKKINPDIFGSMIQAVADEDERSQLGMHYTSVPNILKVLNPLFLDDLRAHLERAGDSPVKLLNLLKRMANIRVFDPACGSGNFLVIAYKQMREIEAEINRRRDETQRKSDISIQNFRGIELRSFSAEIARLALIIAEYQCDVLYRGQKNALAEFLPLDKKNWITCGNALRLDWLDICPPTGTGVKIKSDDLFGTPLEQVAIDFENEGGETYICGNPPYVGATTKPPKDASPETKKRMKIEATRRKEDLAHIFQTTDIDWKSLDYVLGWFHRAAELCGKDGYECAFVTTNSICQGQQVAMFWPYWLTREIKINFARTSFKWSNLAANKAGVTVVVLGLSSETGRSVLFLEDGTDAPTAKEVEYIGPYLVPNTDAIVRKVPSPLNGLSKMDYGSKPADGGGLILKTNDYRDIHNKLEIQKFIKPYIGSDEYIEGKTRYCLWIDDSAETEAERIPFIRSRLSLVRVARLKSTKPKTIEQANTPYKFSEVRHSATESNYLPIVIPIHTSENRKYLPVGALVDGAVVSNAAFALYDAPLWNMALIASRIHLVWIATVCGKLETRYRYSNTLGWNTFPVPTLTEKNKADLTRCAEDILLAREAHFPATIADLYAPDAMPENLRAAHEKNDETLERIYIGRRFKNDTERLEKLFEMYTKMTTKVPAETRQ